MCAQALEVQTLLLLICPALHEVIQYNFQASYWTLFQTNWPRTLLYWQNDIFYTTRSIDLYIAKENWISISLCPSPHLLPPPPHIFVHILILTSYIVSVPSITFIIFHNHWSLSFPFYYPLISLNFTFPKQTSFHYCMVFSLFSFYPTLSHFTTPSLLNHYLTLSHLSPTFLLIVHCVHGWYLPYFLLCICIA